MPRLCPSACSSGTPHARGRGPPREVTEVARLAPQGPPHAVGQMRVAPVENLAEEVAKQRDEVIGQPRPGQLGRELLHRDRRVAELPAAGLRDLRDRLREREQPRPGQLVDLPGMPVLGEGGSRDVGDVLRVHEWLAHGVDRERELARQQRLEEEALAEVLAEPAAADHGPLGAGGLDHPLRALRLLLTAARQQDEPPHARLHGELGQGVHGLGRAGSREVGVEGHVRGLRAVERRGPGRAILPVERGVGRARAGTRGKPARLEAFEHPAAGPAGGTENEDAHVGTSSASGWRSRRTSGASSRRCRPTVRSGACASWSYLRARVARSRRLRGIPLGRMRPAVAIAITSASMSSIASAGRTSTRTRASSGPAFANECMTPGATSTTSPGSATRRRSPRRKRMRPATTSKRSVWSGCTCGIGTAPPGRSPSSKARSSPSVLRAVWVKVKRSPVTGFSSVSPGRMICGFVLMPSLNRDTARRSMAEPPKFIRERLRLSLMDAVAALLDGPRAREAFLLRSSMNPPWSMRIQDEAPLTIAAMVRGHAWVIPDAAEPVRLEKGDVAIMRGPDPYTVADDPTTRPDIVIHSGQQCTNLGGEELVDTMSLGVRTWGNALQGDTAILTGSYQMEGEVSQRLLRTLPALLVLTDDEWDSPIVPLLAEEIVKDDPGQEAVLDRLLDLLVVAVLRAWFARPDSVAPDW